MSSALDKLNLRPQERRLVVGAAAVLFVMLQFWLVWPHFKDWSETKAGLDKARLTLERYHSELGRTDEYRRKLAQLETQDTGVLVEEQARPNVLISRIQAQVARSKINAPSIRPVIKSANSKTNEFFEEQILDLGVLPTGDEELVDFLVSIGTSDLMIRVRELTLQPDASRTKLTGTMKLVASFQKNSPSKPAAATAAPRPAALTANKPSAMSKP
jgi:hypothetical protein